MPEFIQPKMPKPIGIVNNKVNIGGAGTVVLNADGTATNSADLTSTKWSPSDIAPDAAINSELPPGEIDAVTPPAGWVDPSTQALTADKVSKAPTEAAKPGIAPIEPVSNATNPNQPSVEAINNTPSEYYDRIAQSEVYKIPASTSKDKNGKTIAATESEVHEGKLVHSAFNRYTLFNYRGTPLQMKASGVPYIEYNQLDFNPDTLTNPTVHTIVERTSANEANLGYRYAYSDFAMCRYLGRIPNNYMVTLRRFAFPTEDDIITPAGRGADGKAFTKPMPDLARAVTWMSEATGNKIEDILNLGFAYRWKDIEAEVQELDNQNKAKRGIVGGIVDENMWAQGIYAAANGVSGTQNTKLATQADDFDPIKSTYPNHVFGPYNSIRNVLQREGGLDYTNEFTLTFEYELRALNGANPKVMFMDLMANLLTLTYSNAPFWGGAVRYLGGGQGNIGKPLGNAALIQEGKYADFLKSVIGDIGKMAQNLVGDIKANGIGGSNLVNNLLGGGLLKLFNTPQGGQVAHALLTGDATGQWHVTVGNPLNPIAVIGNLACVDTKLSFKGGMGVQDFPEALELKVTLKPARPRDKAEIESMFNAGRGRFYIKPYKGVDINQEKIIDGYGRARGGKNFDRLKMNDALTEDMKKFTNG